MTDIEVVALSLTAEYRKRAIVPHRIASSTVINSMEYAL